MPRATPSCRSVLEAAKGAFKESSANDEVAEFLQAMAIYEAQSENYENVLPLADLLIEKGNKEPALYNAAGVAAFCVGELDKAEKYLDKGKAPPISARSSASWPRGSRTSWITIRRHGPRK